MAVEEEEEEVEGARREERVEEMREETGVMKVEGRFWAQEQWPPALALE